jgi:hypothetical protein
MLPKILNPNMFVGPSKNVIKNVLIQLTVFNKNRHMAKSKTSKK